MRPLSPRLESYMRRRHPWMFVIDQMPPLEQEVLRYIVNTDGPVSMRKIKYLFKGTSGHRRYAWIKRYRQSLFYEVWKDGAPRYLCIPGHLSECISCPMVRGCVPPVDESTRKLYRILIDSDGPVDRLLLGARKTSYDARRKLAMSYVYTVRWNGHSAFLYCLPDGQCGGCGYREDCRPPRSRRFWRGDRTEGQVTYMDEVGEG